MRTKIEPTDKNMVFHSKRLPLFLSGRIPLYLMIRIIPKMKIDSLSLDFQDHQLFLLSVGVNEESIPCASYLPGVPQNMRPMIFIIFQDGDCMREEYDIKNLNPRKNPYAAQTKRQITLNVNTDAIDYFKSESAECGIPYQTLINLYLTDCARKKKKPVITWE